MALLLAPPAAAQIIPTGHPAADILLSQALSEQRLIQTCTALMPETHARVVARWEQDTAQATRLLTAAAVPAEAVVAFATAARPENLLPAPDTPFQDLRQFCATDPDWTGRLNRMELISLSSALPKVLK